MGSDGRFREGRDTVRVWQPKKDSHEGREALRRWRRDLGRSNQNISAGKCV